MNTLLIIDDEIGIQRTISMVLASDTLRIVTASNENQAVLAMKNEFPSVALLDLRLGKNLDGMYSASLKKWIRKSWLSS